MPRPLARSPRGGLVICHEMTHKFARRAGWPVQTFNREPTLSAIAKVFLIPPFSIQGSDSEAGVLLAKQRPKVPAALHEPLAELPLEPDR